MHRQPHLAPWDPSHHMLHQLGAQLANNSRRKRKVSEKKTSAPSFFTAVLFLKMLAYAIQLHDLVS